MIDTDSLHALPALASAYMAEHGWTQGEEEDDAGGVCLTGALRLCSPVPGDSYIAREVFRARNHAEGWNDKYGRTAGEVIDYLAASEITDADLEEVFGPQWREIVALVRTVAGATKQQLNDLAAAWDAARDAACAAARDAACAAARDAARDAACAAAWDAAWDAARDAAQAAAWDAARDAAQAAAWDACPALSTRDLIGTHSYTQAHYDLLVAAWVAVFGKVHADD